MSTSNRKKSHANTGCEMGKMFSVTQETGAHTFASGLFMKVPAMGCLFQICLPQGKHSELQRNV